MFTASNTCGLQSRDFDMNYTLNMGHVAIDVAGAALDAVLATYAKVHPTNRPQGCAHPRLEMARFVRVDVGDRAETILVFSTLDEEGIFVTWQVLPL